MFLGTRSADTRSDRQFTCQSSVLQLSGGRREHAWAANFALMPLGIIFSVLYKISSCAGAHRLPHNRLQQNPLRVFPAQGRNAQDKQGRKGLFPGCSPLSGGEFGGVRGTGDGWHRHRVQPRQGCSPSGRSQHRSISLQVPPWECRWAAGKRANR